MTENDTICSVFEPTVLEVSQFEKNPILDVQDLKIDNIYCNTNIDDRIILETIVSEETLEDPLLGDKIISSSANSEPPFKKSRKQNVRYPCSTN